MSFLQIGKKRYFCKQYTQEIAFYDDCGIIMRKGEESYKERFITEYEFYFTPKGKLPHFYKVKKTYIQRTETGKDEIYRENMSQICEDKAIVKAQYLEIYPKNAETFRVGYFSNGIASIKPHVNGETRISIADRFYTTADDITWEIVK